MRATCPIDECDWTMPVRNKADEIASMTRHVAMVHPVEFEEITGDEALDSLVEFDRYEQMRYSEAGP